MVLSNNSYFLTLGGVNEAKADTDPYSFEYTFEREEVKMEGRVFSCPEDRCRVLYKPPSVMNSSNKISMEKNNLGSYLHFMQT